MIFVASLHRMAALVLAGMLAAGPAVAGESKAVLDPAAASARSTDLATIAAREAPRHAIRSA